MPQLINFTLCTSTEATVPTEDGRTLEVSIKNGGLSIYGSGARDILGVDLETWDKLCKAVEALRKMETVYESH